MTIHLAVYHQHRHMGCEDYLKYSHPIPQKGGATGLVRCMKAKLNEVYLTWFMLESDDVNYDAVFLILDESIIAELFTDDVKSDQFKKFAGEAIAFWLELVKPTNYRIKVLEDGKRLITIEASDISKLTEFFNTKCTGAHHEIQIPETDPRVSDEQELA